MQRLSGGGDPGPRVIEGRPSGLFAIGLVMLVAVGLLFSGLGRPDEKALIAGETAPYAGCTYNRDTYTFTCRDVDGSTYTHEVFADENLSIGYAPGLGTLAPLTRSVGGVGTATRTAAGQTAASTACNVFCMSLTSIGLGAILEGLYARVQQPAEDNMSSFKPDPDPGAPYMPQYPCTHVTFPGFTSGVTTASSLKIEGTWYQNGAPSTNSGVLAQCEHKSKVVIYSKDSAGLMYRCTSYWSRTFVNPAVNASYGTLSQTGSWCAPAARIIVGVVHEPAPNGIADGNANAGEGPDTVLTLGEFSPGATLYKSDVRCESSSGGFQIASREDIGRIVTPACPAWINGNNGEVVRGTMVTIYARVIQDDGWSMIDQYETGPAPDPAAVTQYPQCYVSDGASGTRNVCGFSVAIDGVKCDYPATEDCHSWAALRASSPSRVECYMGPYVVPAENCNFLERQYKGVEVPMTIPNIDGNPATWEGPDPAWEPTPRPTTTATVTVTQSPSPTSTVSATATATQSPSPTSTATATVSEEPSPSPTSTATSTATATSGTGTDTGTGTGTTVSVPATSPNGVPSTEGGNCYPTGTAAWNPVEWVMRPVQCALVWAFVPPDGGFQDWWDGVSADFGGSVPGQWWDVLPVWEAAFEGAAGDGAGCQGPALSTGFIGAKTSLPDTIYPFEACSGVKATVAASSNLFLTVSIGWATAWRLARIVGKPFGYSLDLMKEGKGT